jgi:hypothetical protein
MARPARLGHCAAPGCRRVRIAARGDRFAALSAWIFDDSGGTYGHRRIHAALLGAGGCVGPARRGCALLWGDGAGLGDYAGLDGAGSSRCVRSTLGDRGRGRAVAVHGAPRW